MSRGVAEREIEGDKRRREEGGGGVVSCLLKRSPATDHARSEPFRGTSIAGRSEASAAVSDRFYPGRGFQGLGCHAWVSRSASRTGDI
jgi:hypothetical protein